MNTIGIIGAGNMGSAICRAISTERKVLIADRNRQKLELLDAEVAETAKEVASRVDTLIIAVKPYAFDELAEEIRECTRDKLVISIMAGKSLKYIQERLGTTKVVRGMPNINAAVSRSVTTWIATSSLTEEQKYEVKEIFASMGQEIQVNDEEYMHKATAVFGSVPGIFGEVLTILSSYIESMGISSEDASELAKEVFTGTARYLDQNRISGEDLCTRVATPGGTTRAALSSLDEDYFRRIWNKALLAAEKRSQELS